MIPQTFSDWQYCIVNDCKIDLTKDFARQRLAVYQDKKLAETQQFVSLYGEQHLNNVINWLQIVLNA